jgi:LPXTG-site transpeptidase (sortase) family protein
MSNLDPTRPQGPPQPAPTRVPFLRRHRWLSLGAALVLILGGLAIGTHIASFYARSSSGGSQLLHQLHHKQVAAAQNPVTCVALSDSVSGVQGALEATTIGLNAPVEAGVDDSVLNVAVGKVPGSVWANQPGTMLLAAHDVSYFSAIDRLQPGQTIRFATPCDTYLYRVTGHQIVAAGSPLSTSPAQSLLILETCYPLNALFITSQRYLVTASLERIVVEHAVVPSQVAQPIAPGVPAPAPLAAQGLTLDQNDVQLGVLNLAGSPASSWQQGPEPMADEAAVLADYFAGLRSALQNQPSWWSVLAPSVPFSDAGALQGAQMSYTGSLTPTLSAIGTSLTGATIDVNLDVSGGSAPGRYALHVTEDVIGGQLAITGWSMTRN